MRVNFVDFESKNMSNELISLVNDIVNYSIEEEKRHYEERMTKPKNHIYLKFKRLNKLVTELSKASRIL